MNTRLAPSRMAAHLPSPATVVAICGGGLILLGLSVLFSASAHFPRPYQYLEKQAWGALGAAGLCFAVSQVNLAAVRRRRVAAWLIGGGAALLLVLVLIPGLGVSVKGSRRWLEVWHIRVQVSEFAKLGFLFGFAHYLAWSQTRLDTWRWGFFVPLSLIGLFAVLLAAEPDFGMAAIYAAVAFAMLTMAGARWHHLLAAASMAFGALAVAILHNPNRLRRILEWFSAEPPYHLQQAHLAMATGGWSGVGLGLGRRQHYFLPEAHTDFIAAVIGEELGLAGTMLVVATFVVILIACLWHLRRAPNPFEFQLVLGCTLFITVQAMINLLSVTGMIPPKGTALPFLSAGLSNLIVMGGFVGVLFSTQRRWGRANLVERRARVVVAEPAPPDDPFGRSSR